MANFKTHLITGSVVGGAILFVNNLCEQGLRVEAAQQPAFDAGELIRQVLLGAAIGGIAGVLPDILEPAVDPHHRKTWHSVLLAIALSRGAAKLGGSGLPPQTQICLQSGAAAYLSHLILDFTTPMGLPLM